jgi:DNA helicase-2/ATP-dependent DNA helicase PcrA
LKAKTLEARKRLLGTGRKGWSLAVLVPTKRMTRLVSDAFRQEQARLPTIPHTAAVDVEAAILAAEIVAFLMEPDPDGSRFPQLVALLCSYFHGNPNSSVWPCREHSLMRRARKERTLTLRAIRV